MTSSKTRWVGPRFETQFRIAVVHVSTCAWAYGEVFNESFPHSISHYPKYIQTLIDEMTQTAKYLHPSKKYQ